MKKFKVKLVWEEVYEVTVNATDKYDAEQKALEAMENGKCFHSDSIYSDCETKELK